MSDVVKLNVINVGQFTAADYVAEAVKGKWGYRGEEKYSVTLMKGVGYISVPIGDADLELDIILPTCYDFWLPILNGSTVRQVRVTDSHLKATVAAGESVSACFKVKSDN